MPEIRTDDIRVDTSADQVSFIADELDRLAGAAEALEGEDGQTDKMVMFDSHTATVIAATLRALLRSGAWELLKQPETPREVVIDEYVELAKAFFDDAEARFVNAALDGVARDARA